MTVYKCRNFGECANYVRGVDLASSRTSDALRNKESYAENYLESFPLIGKTKAILIRSSLKDFFASGKNRAESIQKYLKHYHSIRILLGKSAEVSASRVGSKAISNPNISRFSFICMIGQDLFTT